MNYCKNVTFRFIRTVYKYSTKVLLSFYRLNNLKKLKFFSGWIYCLAWNRMMMRSILIHKLQIGLNKSQNVFM